MKQKDIAVVLIIGFVSAVVSFIVSGKVFVTADNRQQKAEVVDAINSSFQTPDKKYFNATSINPTQRSAIGGDSNQDPFSGSGK